MNSNPKYTELTGGGLIRSGGGWTVIKSLRQANIHFKSDERVLGDSDFVERVLKTADESFERKYQLKSQGYDIDKLADRVADMKMGSSLLLTLTDIVLFFPYLIFNFSTTFLSLETLW